MKHEGEQPTGTPRGRRKSAVRAFVSHSSQDRALAELMIHTLSGDGISCFYAPRDIAPLEVWPKRLEAEIATASVVLLLYTRAAGDSDEVYREIEQARNLNKDIWLITERDAVIADRFKRISVGARYHAFVYPPGNEVATFEKVLDQLNKRFGRVDVTARGRIDHGANPFPGRAYTSEDQDIFFGRDAECGHLWEDISTGKERIFLLYGPSGAGKSSLIDAGLRRILSEHGWWFSGPIQPSIGKPDSLALDMWRVAEQTLRPAVQCANHTAAELTRGITDAMDELGFPAYLLWFDHVERLLLLDPDRIVGFFRLARDVRLRTNRVWILTSFREELVAKAERQAKILPEGSWRTWLLRRLTREGALDSVKLPPEKKHDVRIDSDLAEAIVDNLARFEFEDRDGKRIVAVNPVSLQVTCRRLWETGVEGLADITGQDIPNSGLGLEEDVRRFITNTLTNRLEDAIQEIALGLGPERIEQKKDLILLGLLQFVTEDRRRQQLKEETDGNRTRVGRLRGEIVKGLYEKRLLQRTDIGLSEPDYRYELIHDSLAEAISLYRAKVRLLQTLNTLESTMRGVQHENNGLSGVFDRNSDLLAELEDARSDDTGFFDDEREFLLRCALGGQRLSAKENVSLDGWAVLLAETSAEAFVSVLRDALNSTTCDNSVKFDVISLLRKKQFRERVSPDCLNELTGLILRIALTGPRSIQRVACIAVCEIGEPMGGVYLLSRLTDPKDEGAARRALQNIRDAADRRQIRDSDAYRAFKTQWSDLPLGRRLRFALPLWLHRTSQSYTWILVSALLASVGMALAFVPMGLFGAALTFADANAAWAKGPFQGAAIGSMYGIAVAVSLMLYWFVWQGGFDSPLRNRFPVGFAALLGGSMGGLACTFLIGFIFLPSSLYSAGWLLGPSAPASLIRELFVDTRYGWWAPLLGAATAVGTSWSASAILANAVARGSMAAQSRTIRTPSDAFHAFLSMLRPLWLSSWRILVSVAIGGVVTFVFLRPGPGVCDSAHLAMLSNRLACDPLSALPPLPVRIAGMVFIFWIGGLFLEAGVLAGLVSIESDLSLIIVGRENEGYLRDAQ